MAGLAANHCSSLVNGLMPLRLGLAATLTEVTLSRPGRTNSPAPFLETEAVIASSRPASAALTSLDARPERSAMKFTKPVLFNTSEIGFAAFAAFAGALLVAI